MPRRPPRERRTATRLGSTIGIGIVSPHIVIYRHSASDDVVTVLRIVHGPHRIIGKLLRKGT
ncbi:MAG TPA: hypothetical protein VE690_21265 [Rhodopila sp.]|nr:hypothetical protein [Rhodopila sp.]